MSTQNPSRAASDWPPVIVGGAFQTGLNLMRDLLRKGVQVVAVDHDTSHQGFRSTYGKTYECPNPDTHPEEWVRFIRNLVDQLGRKPVFIPAADIYISAIGRHARGLQDRLIVFPEAVELQAALSSKDFQYAAATRNGFPCPRLSYIQSRDELENFAAVAQFPCLLKPRSPREWDVLPDGNPVRGRKVVIVDTAPELLQTYDQIAPFRHEAIAQEVIQGLGSLKRVYLSVWGEGGSLIGHVLMREVRDYPPFTGMPSVVEPYPDEEITNAAARFLSAIKYRGICEFEVKRDSRNNELRLIEMNPRYSGTGDSAYYAGLEIGWLHYLDMIGHPVQPVTPSAPAFHHIALKIEAAETPPFLLNGKIGWKQFLAPYRTKRAYFDFDWRDRRLALVTLVTCIRYLAGAMWRHLSGKR